MQEGNDEEFKHISIEFMHHNMKQIDVVRTAMSIVGGVLAGILNCKSEYGLLCFVIIYGSLAFFLALKMKFDLRQHTIQSPLMFVTSDLQKNGLSFVLFWTLTYALVYIY